jgi:hypothetical protein
MKPLGYICFGWLLTVLASWCAGKLLFRRLSVRLHRLEEDVMAFLLGSACLSTLIFLICVIHLAYKPVFLTVALAAIAAGIQQRIWQPSGESLPRLSGAWRLLFYTVYVFFAGVYLVNALAPESSPDGSSYHLGFVAQYARARGFVAIPENFYANLPQGMEMLFLSAFLWGRHSAAALVHCTYLLLLPFLTLNYGRRLRMPVVGAAGGLLVFAAPIAGVAGTTAYNDVAVAAVAFAVFALIEIWYEQRDAALLIPIGILAGFDFAIKYTAFMAPIYAVAFVAYASWRSRKAVMRSTLLVAVSAAAVMAPALVKNWIVVRNPVSPFLNRVFPNPYVHVDFEEELCSRMRSYDVHSLRELVYEVTARGEKTQGVLGPVFLLAPLSLLALRCAPGRRLLLAFLAFLLPYPSNLATRFLLPAAMFLAPGIAMGIDAGGSIRPFVTLRASYSWPPYAGEHAAHYAGHLGVGSGMIVALAVVVHAILSWPSHIPWYAGRYVWRLNEIPVRAAARLEPEEDYLLRRLGAAYQMARFIERATPPGSRIYAFGTVPMAYSSRGFVCTFCSGTDIRLLDGLMVALHPSPRLIRSLTLYPVPRRLRGVRLVETAAGAAIIPGLLEVSVFGSGGAFRPSDAWRVDAHPFPWDAGLAFDRNPVTRWKTWQKIARGAWIAVEFEHEQTVAAVRFETGPDQVSVQWQLEGKENSAGWVPLEVVSKEELVAAPLHLRRAATAELRRNHFQYLWLDAQPDLTDFRTNPKEWGIRLLAQFQGISLYHID